MTAGCGRLRTRCLGFLMPRFAVDNTRHCFSRVLADPLPNAHHVPAGCINKDAALLFQFGTSRNLGPERRNDNDITLLQIPDVRVLLFATEKADIYRPDLVVDFRVMNDLTEYVDR